MSETRNGLPIYRPDVGDRVFLHETTHWILGDNNPARGTEWECEGIVTRVYSNNSIDVRWDNQRTNTYKALDGDIRPVYENAEEVLI